MPWMPFLLMTDVAWCVQASCCRTLQWFRLPLLPAGFGDDWVEFESTHHLLFARDVNPLAQLGALGLIAVQICLLYQMSLSTAEVRKGAGGIVRPSCNSHARKSGAAERLSRSHDQVVVELGSTCAGLLSDGQLVHVEDGDPALLPLRGRDHGW